MKRTPLALRPKSLHVRSRGVSDIDHILASAEPASKDPSQTFLPARVAETTAIAPRLCNPAIYGYQTFNADRYVA